MTIWILTETTSKFQGYYATMEGAIKEAFARNNFRPINITRQKDNRSRWIINGPEVAFCLKEQEVDQ